MLLLYLFLFHNICNHRPKCNISKSIKLINHFLLFCNCIVTLGTDATIVGRIKSVQEIMAAQQNGSLTVTKTDTIVNHSATKCEGGSLKVKEDRNITDDTP